MVCEICGLAQLSLEAAPSLPGFDNDETGSEETDTPEDRLDRWQRKLLDLTLRNPLLNHRATKTSLTIICPEPHLLEDKLAEGARITISPVPQLSAQSQDEEVSRTREGISITDEYARHELMRRNVLVDLPAEQLSKHAVEIYRKAQTSLQEGGANTLYLAVGFLLWKRDMKDERRFRAPLILLPVTLERKSVRSGIKMLAHDDEPRFNTTLLEMLRRDFSIDIKGFDGALPTDESGIDVLTIWNRVRLAVKETPGFEVVEDVLLGHFSFAKFLMWKDLVDRTASLRDNVVVKHLIDTPRESYISEGDFTDARQLDKNYNPSDLLAPLPADASQMAAIANADKCMDFVLIGPPGTGKSQTISNMISHLLGKGKTVLFVSEKTAALDVVYNRLEEIGLGRHCLELHSNKARKADVLRQLKLAWEATASELQTEWNQKADILMRLRNRLNNLVAHLHKKHRNGLTAHYAIGVSIRDKALASAVKLSWPNAEYHDEISLKNNREIAEKLSIQAKAIGDFTQSPFLLIEADDWSPQWEQQMVERARALKVAAENVSHSLDNFCKTIQVELPGHSMARLEGLAELASLLLDSHRRDTAFALASDGAGQIEALKDASKRLKVYRDTQLSLSCSYEPFAWRELDGEELGLRWKKAQAKWWLKRFFEQRNIISLMRISGAQENPDLPNDFPLLAILRQEGEAIDRLDQKLSNFKDWSGHATHPETLDALHCLGERFRAVISSLVDNPLMLVDIRNKLRTLLHDGNDLLSAEASVGKVARTFLNSHEKLKQTISEFEIEAGSSVQKVLAASGDILPEVIQIGDSICTRHNELNAWCAWRRRRSEAIGAGLLPLIQAIEQGQIVPDEIEKTFEASYCSWWSSAIIGEDQVLRLFSAPEHEAAIEKFRSIDDEFQKLTARYIEARLSGMLPDQENVKKASGWGILRRELQKTRRHKPVRKLLEEAPDVLTSLTPCFMMSPLSVAQYLPVHQALFDIVIFDEASQITVWDAVGSIARGKQVIVAGDPKQMPPTNFFSRTDDDPDGDVNVEGDLESILDEMLASGIPSSTLKLHYRSHFESLIAFSNNSYYDNALITFPSPQVQDQAISIRRPDSFYARGGARNNQGEAKEIVMETIRRLTHSNPEVRGKSIGIVTFNSEQQRLIEDMLDDARRKHPEIETAFSREYVTEPVFVKNLETVQGDERDVIMFSITYGPDQSGHVTMNFGPLNREGGERRLNVAVTRARTEMIVFSSLHPDQIDLSRSQAQAVSDLKGFLEYAEKGQVALGSAVQGYRDDFESPFEMAVAQELQAKGWRVHPQVGVSAYRIDLGIVHPDASGRYLAGIECDGATYHSSAFARERDKIRQSVLENLGWTIFRIWSTEWWTNKEGALGKINDALHQSLNAEKIEGLKRTRPDEATEEDEMCLETDTDVNRPEPHASRERKAKTPIDILKSEFNKSELQRETYQEVDKMSEAESREDIEHEGEKTQAYERTPNLADNEPDPEDPKYGADADAWYEDWEAWKDAWKDAGGVEKGISRLDHIKQKAPFHSDNQVFDKEHQALVYDSSMAVTSNNTNVNFRPVRYSEFEGQAGPDPRNVKSTLVAEGLYRIVNDEGPVLAKRVIDIYLRGCGIRRMGGELKSIMSKVLRGAMRQGLIVKVDETGSQDLLDSILRLQDTPPVVARERGPRSFDEIPPSEIQLVARQLLRAQEGKLEAGSEDHLRAILTSFDLHRLTTPVRTKLLDILQHRYFYVDEAIYLSENHS